MSKFYELKLIKLQQRIENAKSKVDNKSPIVHSNNVLGMNKLRDDASNYMYLMKRNMQLLVNINSTMRTVGAINTFRDPILVPNNVSVRQLKLKNIEKDNLRLGLRVLGARSTLNSNTMKNGKKTVKINKTSSRREISCSINLGLLSKYTDPIAIPSNQELCRRLFRPTIFFDLEIHNVRPLGRVIIEMYTEAAPQVVRQFLIMCQNNDTQRFQFTRIFPSLWMEALFNIDDQKLNCGLIEYDMRVLKNDSCGGIFSFQLNEKRTGCLFVAISFKPLAVVNGRRVAFARIKRGFRIIHCLQDMGTRNGKITKKIVVVNCGHLL